MRDTAAGASTSAEIGWVGPGDKALSMRCELLHRNFNSWGNCLWSASSAALPIGTFQITATPWSAWYVKAWAFGHPGGGGIWIAINLLCGGGRGGCHASPDHTTPWGKGLDGIFRGYLRLHLLKMTWGPVPMASASGVPICSPCFCQWGTGLCRRIATMAVSEPPAGPQGPIIE